MEWDIIYIKDQNCQKRALIIENLTESKEQLFTLPSLLSAQTESHLVAVNTIISFIFKKRKKTKNIAGCLEWEHARHKGHHIYCLHMGLEYIPALFIRLQMWGICITLTSVKGVEVDPTENKANRALQWAHGPVNVVYNQVKHFFLVVQKKKNKKRILWNVMIKTSQRSDMANARFVFVFCLVIFRGISQQQRCRLTRQRSGLKSPLYWFRGECAWKHVLLWAGG